MSGTTSVARWDVFEVTLKGPNRGNPYLEVEVDATFTYGNRSINVPGFYDGDGEYRVRFMPDTEGEWRYETSSNSSKLDSCTGAFACTASRPDQHGPVRVVNKHHFAHADGTPYFPFGTTTYAWMHQPLKQQALTLKTLKQARFNKLRMMIFPKDYIYNNDEPVMHFYERRKDGSLDWDRPNFAMFRHVDKQIETLRDMGLQADLILFHACDRWGYRDMGHERDFRYLRYLCARLAAYSNVWWAPANEYDFLIDVKPLPHWEEIFKTLERFDPYRHLKSIHNGDPAKMYNHRLPWVDHVCLQNWDVKQTAQWRNDWGKPILNDEPEYEGNIPRPWGNISGRELVHRFWITVMRGGYAGHGETFMHPKDDLWWSKGGKLRGESAPRIGFLRDLIEEDVRNGLTPYAYPDDSWEWTRVSGAHDDGVIFIYFGEHQPVEWAVGLPKADGDYEIDLIDTWEMTVTPLKKAPLPVAPAYRQAGGQYSGGEPEAAFGVRLPGKPFQAVRVRPRRAPKSRK